MIATSAHEFSSISRGGTQWVYGGKLFIFATKYDETNPRPRAATTPDVLDHGDATRLH
jgi:hypothetical protein